jgi:broad specificity phosphatase PhoE
MARRRLPRCANAASCDPMALIYLVRHAQASFGTDDYDRLSELGRQQSRWLAEHWLQRGLRFSRVMTGRLKRQKQTAEEMLITMGLDVSQMRVHAGLDEFHGGEIYSAFTGGADPLAQQRADSRGYWQTLRQAMMAWSRDELTGVPETWLEFGLRTRQALRDVSNGLGRSDVALVVSSGGSISRVIVDCLGAGANSMIDLNQQYRNTGYCEMLAVDERLRVISVNAIPHLERADRRDAVTYA